MYKYLYKMTLNLDVAFLLSVSIVRLSGLRWIIVIVVCLYEKPANRLADLESLTGDSSQSRRINSRKLQDTVILDRPIYFGKT